MFFLSRLISLSAGDLTQISAPSSAASAAISLSNLSLSMTKPTSLPAFSVIKEGNRVVGAKVRHNGDMVDVKAKMVIAADGFESEFGRWAGLKSVILAKNDIISCIEYRMIGVDSDADFTDFYLGNCAPAGYIWVFPKGEKEANVGIGVTISAMKSGEMR